MGKRKVFFSIYILIFTIFGGIFHGSFMAYAGHMDSMASDYKVVISENEMIGHGHEEDQQKIKGDLGNENPIMACCEESGSYVENESIFQERKSEILNFEYLAIENRNVFEDTKKSAFADLSYEYFSPPEEIILESVIRIE